MFVYKMFIHYIKQVNNIKIFGQESHKFEKSVKILYYIVSQ